MPLARDLHPELGYVGSTPRMLKLGYASAFAVFGLVAVVSGVTVFMARPDTDPMNALALAPAEALSPSTSPSSASPAKAKPTEGQEILNAGVIQSPCRDDVGERLSDDCASERMRRSHPVLAVNERPAIATVAIGHREDPVADRGAPLFMGEQVRHPKDKGGARNNSATKLPRPQSPSP